jgi:hypothetical protein
MKSITDIIAEINAAKDAIKAGAVKARDAAPKGEKMAHGQHFSAEQGAKVATTALQIVTARGYVPAAVAAKVSKTGRTEFLVTYREPQTLAQRVATVMNAAARRKAKREADKAAKETAAKAKVAPMPSSGDALAALAQLGKAA